MLTECWVGGEKTPNIIRAPAGIFLAVHSGAADWRHNHGKYNRENSDCVKSWDVGGAARRSLADRVVLAYVAQECRGLVGRQPVRASCSLAQALSRDGGRVAWQALGERELDATVGRGRNALM